MQNLEELQTWLSRQNNSPKKRHRVNTLMDIVGVTYLENNWSDVYAYFFKQHESLGLGRLFIDTLNDLVTQATGKPTLEMSDYNVARRVVNGIFIALILLMVLSLVAYYLFTK